MAILSTSTDPIDFHFSSFCHSHPRFMKILTQCNTNCPKINSLTMLSNWTLRTVLLTGILIVLSMGDTRPTTDMISVRIDANRFRFEHQNVSVVEKPKIGTKSVACFQYHTSIRGDQPSLRGVSSARFTPAFTPVQAISSNLFTRKHEVSHI